METYKKLYGDAISDLQQIVFEEATRYKYELNFENFVKGYMQSKYRRRLDNGNTRIANMTWDELMSYLERDEKHLFQLGVTNIDRLQAGWIGRLYSLLQIETNKSSEDIYEKFPLEKMQQLFIPLHTVAEQIAVDKMIKML